MLESQFQNSALLAILCGYAYGGEIIAYALRHVIGRADWIAERQADVRFVSQLCLL